MQLSIVIVCYKSIELIEDCLNSIVQYNDLATSEIEIILVDNSPSEEKDRLKLFLSTYTTAVDIRYIASDNVGYGNGNNIGVKLSKSQNIIIMNPDVRIVEPTFAKLVVLLENRNLGMIGVNFVKGISPFYFKPECITFINQIFIKFYTQRLHFIDTKMYFSGSFLVFNKKAFVESGQFDPNIFLYYEEPDISNRMLANKWELLFAKDITVLHMAQNRPCNQNMSQI
jgi:GT2 family glycosyltransferase